MVVGRRGAQAEGGEQEVWRMGRGEIWVRLKWVFYRRVVHANMHDFEVKKTQGKNCAMQRHGQVLPPTPAAALPESPQGNTYAANSCAIGGEGAGDR
jgi:hypothetical protein